MVGRFREGGVPMRLTGIPRKSRNELSALLSAATNIEIFPAAVYQFSEIPAEIVLTDVVVICASAFAICSLAALIPAWVAARLDPVKALRHD